MKIDNQDYAVKRTDYSEYIKEFFVRRPDLTYEENYVQLYKNDIEKKL